MLRELKKTDLKVFSICDLITLGALGTYVWCDAGNGVDSNKPYDLETTWAQITCPGRKFITFSFKICVEFPT